MRYLKGEGIIISTFDIYDADRLLHIFTRERGLLKARARGVRKTTSKLTGHLLLYVPTQLELLESDAGYFTIAQAQVAESDFQGIPYPLDSLYFLSQVSILAETVSKLLVEGEAHPELYDYFSQAIVRLRVLTDTERQERGNLVVIEFLIKTLSALGYRPELYACVITGEPISSDFIAWHSRLGGVLSKTGWQQSAGEGVIIHHSQTLVALRAFVEQHGMAERLVMPEAVQKELIEIVQHYVQTQLGVPLKSLGGILGK